jgi:outer membrane receptor protein involved in Fe transport
MKRSSLRAGAGRLALALAILGAGAASVHAEADAPATPPTSTTVEAVTVQGETVVTAPVALPLSTPYSGSTITAEEVRDLSAGPTVNLETMLQNQPSVFSYADGPLGVGTNIFYRGFNSGQFSQLYDGVALDDVFNGGVTGGADTVNKVLLLPRNVDSVELFRGINNPDVNSYNSLGGTINFLPRLPSATPGGEIGGAYGSFHTFDTHASFNTGDIAGVRQYFSYDHAESDGWIPYTKDRNTNVFYHGTWDGANGDHVGLILVYNDNNGHTPFQMPTALANANGGYYQYSPSVAYENDKDSEYLAIVDTQFKLSKSVDFDQKFFAGDNNYRRVSFANPADYESATQPYELYSQGGTSYFWKPAYGYVNGPSYVPASVFGSTVLGDDYHLYKYSTWGYGWQPTVTADLPANHVTAGANITVARLHSAEYWYGNSTVPAILGYNDTWDEHDQRVIGSVYIQDDIHLFDDRLHATPGLKYIYAYTADVDDVGIYYPFRGTPSIHDTFLSPTLGVDYKWTDDFATFLAFGENFKLPDITALYNGVAGNANELANGTYVPFSPTVSTIKPEYVYDYEFGARYHHGGLSAEIDFYREDFFNTFIDASNEATGSTLVTNGGSSRYQGVEVRLLDNFHLANYGDLQTFVNYSYNQATFRSSFYTDSNGADLDAAGALVTKGEEMGDVPEQLVSFGGTWLYDGFRATLRGRYIGPQETLDYNTGVPDGVKIEGYFLMDIGLAKTFNLHNLPWAKTVKLGVDLNNVFNKYYYNYADTSCSEYYACKKGLTSDVAEFASPGAPRNVMGRIDIGF